jgi:hypothetical protein
MLNLTEQFAKRHGRLPLMKTGKFAMTLTPPPRGERRVGGRIASLLVAERGEKMNDERNAIGRNAVAATKLKPSGCR